MCNIPYKYHTRKKDLCVLRYNMNVSMQADGKIFRVSSVEFCKAFDDDCKKLKAWSSSCYKQRWREWWWGGQGMELPLQTGPWRRLHNCLLWQSPLSWLVYFIIAVVDLDGMFSILIVLLLCKSNMPYDLWHIVSPPSSYSSRCL